MFMGKSGSIFCLCPNGRVLNVYGSPSLKQGLHKSTVEAYYLNNLQYASLDTIAPARCQILCCLLGGVFAGIRAAGSDVKEMYFIWGIDGEPQHPALTAFLKFWSFVIIFTNFVPISLLVTLDMVKAFQSALMGWDRAMYHEAREIDGTRRPMPAKVSGEWRLVHQSPC